MTSCLASWNNRSSRFLPLALSTPLLTFSSLHPSSTHPYVPENDNHEWSATHFFCTANPSQTCSLSTLPPIQAQILSRSAMSALPSQSEGVLLRADIADWKPAWFEGRYKLAASMAKGIRKGSHGQGIR